MSLIEKPEVRGVLYYYNLCWVYMPDRAIQYSLKAVCEGLGNTFFFYCFTFVLNVYAKKSLALSSCV